jgi:hypothetical protein
MARRKKQNEDLPQENLDSSDDTFGLPEIEYEPLKRVEPSEDVVPEETVPEEVEQPSAVDPFESETEPSELSSLPEQPVEEEFVEDNQFYEPSYSYSYQDERPAVWPKVLGFVVLLAIVAGGIYYFVSYRPQQLAQEAKERRELLAMQEEARKKEAEQQAAQDRLAEQQRAEAAAAAEQEAATAKPEPGTIETLSGRSGLYYVVVASSIDGDLIMDYAKKLSSNGVTAKIIPPFGQSKFHRLTVAEGDTYASAQATADGMKGGDLGNELWVIKY